MLVSGPPGNLVLQLQHGHILIWSIDGQADQPACASWSERHSDESVDFEPPFRVSLPCLQLAIGYTKSPCAILRHVRARKSEILNPKQTRMSESQMTPTGGSSTRGSAEENDDGRFAHSDIHNLNLFRISDFVLRICCPPRSKIALGHLVGVVVRRQSVRPSPLSSCHRSSRDQLPFTGPRR